jgi:uncharacterized caspase-like protein
MSSSSSLGFDRSIAVVIGVDEYGHGLPPLRNAVRDAIAVGDVLQRQGFEVLRLLDAEASLLRLEDLFQSVLPSLQPAPERLLVYFAGHGLAQTDDNHGVTGFLLPADARAGQEDSYWPMAHLFRLLQPFLCKHLLVILDCCFAGTFPRPTVWEVRADDEPAPLVLERFRHYSSHRSFQLLLSTAQDEVASDRILSRAREEPRAGGRHSPFGLALLEALDPSLAAADFNGDGLITATELYVYVRDRLVSLLAGTGARQTPALRHLGWHDRGEFLFLVRG